MKLAIERAALLKSLAHVQSVVERRTTIPILSNVKLEAADGALAPDRDRHGPLGGRAEPRPRSASQAPRPRPRTRSTTSCASCPRACASRSSGPRAAPRSRCAPGAAPSICPACRPTTFPAMTDEGLDHSFAIGAAELRRLIDRTRFAISTEETRYYLNGIFLHAVEEGAGELSARRRHRRPSAGPGRDRRCPRAPKACRR